ncbi:TonB-linked outer membrane protein, SusC/RagA family [Arachidicoccus rhizosphaerae]|uniref:TonB-linked outer membrane protein, SusC/RagA family n=1 Tax=Arachidicoccus rhizosphaerae TaxID=551991 RepID=A0A1H3XK85_9BACT|nr:TonB-dependent receptor [Arachidicoccus rhizosphaerae]SDZ99032.1 TonB-linked outer membrane protein, SusC/RagA family [Arachidicoccus rhizosphaerae]
MMKRQVLGLKRLRVFFLSSMLIFCGFLSTAQNLEILQGRVLSSIDSTPLPSASVRIKGTTQGTMTNAKGEFTINAIKEAILIISSVGYEQTEVSGESSSMQIFLEPSTGKAALDQVVVVGYGSQRKQDVTGAVGIVDMGTVAKQPIVGANEALAGQMPGVQVSFTNGIPGGGPQVQIRGVGAIGAGSTPLYVVDGFPLSSDGAGTVQISNPLNDIPASDIASISVLKDASATAIYGSRGANGVVIITTKQGTEGKLKFNLDAYTGIQKIPGREVPSMMNATQFAEFQKEIIEDNNAYTGQNNAIPDIYQNPEALGEGINWFDAITRTAPMTSANFNLSGGSKYFKIYASGGYMNQEGVVLATDYSKFFLRVNLSGQISKKISMGLNLSPTYSYGHNGVTGGNERNDAFGAWEVANPIPAIYNDDGSYNAMIGTDGTWNQPNPVMVLKQTVHKHTQTHLLSSAYINYEIIPSLTFKSTFNVDLDNEDQTNFSPSTLGSTNNPPPHIPSGSFGQSKYLNWANENSLTFKKQFEGGHSLTLLGVFSEQKQTNNSASFNGTEYPDDAIQTLNAAALITGGTYADSWALASYLGRVNYSYQDKYLLTATIRRDGSSRFGENNRWGTFPSVALGWDLAKEPWILKEGSKLSQLKLRASYGITGNDQIGNFTYMSQLVTGNYVFGNSLASGRKINSISNPNLAWERTAEVNLGVDLGFLNNKLTFSADFYQSRTKSLLLNLDIPSSSGFSSSIANVGQVQNRGFELSLNTINVSNRDFNWTSGFNFTLNRNKTLELGPGQTEIQSASNMEGHPTNITRIGLPVGMLFGYKVLGLYQNAEDVQNSPAFADAIPGNLKMQDVDGDGQITPVSDFTIIGNPYPKFNYGFTNNLTYKRFSLNLVFSGSYGADRLKANFASLHNIDGIFNVTTDVINRWRSEDDPGDGRVPTTAGSSLGRVMFRDVNSWAVYKASYLWCRNISLSYNLPEKIGSGFFNSIQVYGSVQNAFILTSYPGNPAVSNYTGANGYGSALTPGIDYTNYPVPRTFVFGIKLSY